MRRGIVELDFEVPILCRDVAGVVPKMRQRAGPKCPDKCIPILVARLPVPKINRLPVRVIYKITSQLFAAREKDGTAHRLDRTSDHPC